MRYPVGYRYTLREAFNAAMYATQTTGMRYRVWIGTPYRGRKFRFTPAQMPPPEPFTSATEL